MNIPFTPELIQHRETLVEHARFMLHASRTLRTGHLQSISNPAHRTIEYRGADMQVEIVYSHAAGCHLNIHTDHGSMNLGIRRMERFPTRLRFWRNRFKEWHNLLDFRQHAILRALLYSFKPLRKGSSLRLAARPPLQSGNQAAAGLPLLRTP